LELYLSYTILGLILLLVIWQDLKHRAIHFTLPILVFIASLAVHIFSDDLNFIMIFKNIGFVSVNIIGLVLYFSVKNKSVVNPIDSMIGLGDILFFIAITPLFDLKSFIVFFIAGMVFSLVTHLISNQFKTQKNIPLAGYLSVFLIGSIIIEHVLNFNLTTP